MRMVNINKSMRNVNTVGNKGRGSRGGRNWNYRWFPNDVPTRIHFGVPEVLYDNGESQDPWKLGYSHWVPRARDGRGGSIECGDYCVVCAYSDPQKFGLDIVADSSMSKCYRDLYIGIAGWIEEWFHLVPAKSAAGKDYTKRVLCEKRTCEMCRNKLPKVFGNPLYTQISYPVWKSVFEPFQERVSRFCRCGGRLAIFDYRCEKCGNMLIDFLNSCSLCHGQNVEVDLDDGIAHCTDCGAEWSIYESEDPDLSARVNRPMECVKCGHRANPMPSLKCALPGETCDKKPDPISLFDTSMVVVKKDRRTEIVSWKIAEPDARLFSAESQCRPGASAEERQIAEKIAERNAKVLDLNEVLTAQSPSEQARYIGLPDPWGQTAGKDAQYWKPSGDPKTPETATTEYDDGETPF